MLNEMEIWSILHSILSLIIFQNSRYTRSTKYYVSEYGAEWTLAAKIIISEQLMQK